MEYKVESDVVFTIFVLHLASATRVTIQTVDPAVDIKNSFVHRSRKEIVRENLPKIFNDFIVCSDLRQVDFYVSGNLVLNDLSVACIARAFFYRKTYTTRVELGTNLYERCFENPQNWTSR